MDAKLNASAAGGEGVLATFFNSLLNKKPGTPGGGGGAGSGANSLSGSPSLRNGPSDGSAAAAGSLSDKITVRNDAAAELERLTRNAANSKKEIDFNEITNTAKKEIDFSQTDC